MNVIPGKRRFSFPNYNQLGPAAIAGALGPAVGAAYQVGNYLYNSDEMPAKLARYGGIKMKEWLSHRMKKRRPSYREWKIAKDVQMKSPGLPSPVSPTTPRAIAKAKGANKGNQTVFQKTSRTGPSAMSRKLVAKSGRSIKKSSKNLSKKKIRKGKKKIKAKMRKTRKGKANHPRNVVAETFEAGGAVTDDEVVYVGHGFASDRVLNVLAKAVVKRVLEDNGHYVDNVKYKLALSGKIVLVSDDNSNDHLITKQELLITHGTSTCLTVADALVVLMKNHTAGAEAQLNTLEYYTFDWTNEGNSTLGFYRLTKSYDLKKMMLHFNCKSALTVQNVTLAGLTTDDAGVKVNSESVVRNPLKGQLYKFSGTDSVNMNSRVGATDVNTVANSKVQGQAIRVSSATGLLKSNYATLLTTGLDTSYWKKPPAAFELVPKPKSAKIKLECGQISTFNIHVIRKMTVWNFWRKYATCYKPIVGEYVDFKFSDTQMLGLEKWLDSRTANDNIIELHFELNQRYSCGVTCSKPYRRSLTSVYVNDTAI